MAVVVAMALAACSAPTVAPTSPPTTSSVPVLRNVTSMVVLGDSMSLGVNACPDPGACAAESWAAGTDPTVDSVADRLRALTGTPLEVTNLSRSGGRLRDAAENADAIGKAAPGLFVMLLGANDACSSSIGAMTPVTDFAAELVTLFTAIESDAPSAHLLVLSVPDLNRLWEANHDDPSAVRLWNGSTSCTSLLGDPDSTSPAAAQRRADVAARVDDFNAALAQACGAMPKCVYDDGAVHAIEFERDDISTIDYFHPSVSAQAKIADAAWKALLRLG